MTVPEVIPAAPGARSVRVRRTPGRDLLELARPYQWPKNLVVLPLALLAGPSWTLGTGLRLAWAVALFTLASAAVYAVNDIADQERDRQHPRKRTRPIASGRVPVSLAAAFAGVLGVAMAGLAAAGPWTLAWPVLAYLGVNLLYSLGLKNMPLVDVFAVAAGFVLRLLLGALVVGAALSGWLVLAVLCGCLLLSLGKRRHELALAERGGTVLSHRPALAAYSVPLLDQLILLNAALGAMAFLTYLRTGTGLGVSGDLVLIVSAPFALFTLFRYLQVVMVQQGGGDPVKLLLRDRTIVVTTLLWLACAGLAVLVGPTGTLGAGR